MGLRLWDSLGKNDPADIDIDSITNLSTGTLMLRSLGNVSTVIDTPLNLAQSYVMRQDPKTGMFAVIEIEQRLPSSYASEKVLDGSLDRLSAIGVILNLDADMTRQHGGFKGVIKSILDEPHYQPSEILPAVHRAYKASTTQPAT